MDYVVGTLLVLLLFFLLFREVNCWYWKINNIVEKLEGIDGKLKTLINLPSGTKTPPSASSPHVIDVPQQPQTPVPQFSPEPESLRCPQCNKSLSIDDLKIGDNGLTKCPHCKDYFEVEQE